MILLAALLWQFRALGAPSTFLGAPVQVKQRPYTIDPIIVSLLRLYLAEIYGVDLLVDVFAGRSDALLSLHGPLTEDLYWQCKLDGHALFVYANWKDYDSIIQWLMEVQLRCVIIAPMWEQYEWYSLLLRFSSHLWFLPSGPSVMSSVSQRISGSTGSSPWRVFAAIADFRCSGPAAPIVIQQLPDLEACGKLVKTAKPLVRLSTTDVLSREECLPKSPFNVKFLRKASDGIVPDSLRKHVLDSMVNGFTSHYRGGSHFLRDFSSRLKDNEVKLAMEKMLNEVKKGYCLGPFDQCPFPSSWCSSQAYISQLFFIPKHKFIKDSGYRLIANRSYPVGRSFNDLVERHDCTKYISGYTYYTFQSFITRLQQLGSRCLIALFDIKDAYKNCKIRPEELWQQLYRVGNKYFIDLGGMFGSRSAGDSWQLVMEFLAICIREHCKVPELKYFVDNNINLTPAVNGREDTVKANTDFDAIIQFLTEAAVPYHDIVRPSTKVRFLGWDIDTVKMIISCPPERLQWIRDILRSGIKGITLKVIKSVTGLLEYLAAVLPFLRAPLGWLQKREAAQTAGVEDCDDDFKARFVSYFNYIEVLLRDWNGSTSVFASLSTDNPDVVIYSDASSEYGYGMLEARSRCFGFGLWTANELRLAERGKSISSTHLEIMAITKAICTFAKSCQAVQVFTDSAAAAFILQKRYDKKSDHSQGLIIAMDRFCRNNGISLYFTHVLRTHEMIQLVDELSKGVVSDKLMGWREVKPISIEPILF